MRTGGGDKKARNVSLPSIQDGKGGGRELESFEFRPLNYRACGVEHRGEKRMHKRRNKEKESDVVIKCGKLLCALLVFAPQARVDAGALLAALNQRRFGPVRVRLKKVGSSQSRAGAAAFNRPRRPLRRGYNVLPTRQQMKLGVPFGKQ